MDIYSKISELKIVPVVVLNSLDEVSDKIEALIDGGLPIAEVCFRTPVAKEAIEIISKKYPEVILGAGTVINATQCKDAIKAGAKFIVSPGLSKDVALICKENNIPYLPGTVTPTEIMEALDLGINVVKFFPASNYGGLATIKAICSAFPSIKIMPTGGINLDNINDYLSFNKIIAWGGSFMMKGNKEEMTSKTKEAVNKVRGL